MPPVLGEADPILEVRGLSVHFPVFKGFVQRLLGGGDVKVHAVDDVSFSLHPGEVLGLVGESGCGKSTIARTAVGLTAPTEGAIAFRGHAVRVPPRLAPVLGLPRTMKVLLAAFVVAASGVFSFFDPTIAFGVLALGLLTILVANELAEREMLPADRALRRQIQIVFQDPHAALNPAITVGEAIADVLRTHGIPSEEGTRIRVTAGTDLIPFIDQVLEDVGLHPPAFFRDKYPKELSGGQKQRVVLGRVIALRPVVVVADEPVSMLDMSIRARVLRLLLDLRTRYGLTYVFITHDLATAKLICERIAIMYLGQIVELGPTREVYADPKHPYTRALLEAIPVPDPDRRREKKLPKGEVPSAVNPPAGCRFHPRCPVATPTCGWEPRDVFDVLDERELDEATRKRDEEVLGPRDLFELDGQRMRIPAERERSVSLATRRGFRVFRALAAVAAVVFIVAALSPSPWPAGWRILASTLYALVILDIGLVFILILRFFAARQAPVGTTRDALDRLRAHATEVLQSAPESMQRAVTRLEATDDGLVLEFAPTADPGTRQVGTRDVRCVLY